MKIFRHLSLLFALSLAAVAQAETYPPEVEALLKPMPEQAVMMGNIILTLDEGMQDAVQQEMNDVVAEDAAIVRGWAVVLNAATGQVLAMVGAGSNPEGANIACAPVLPAGGTTKLFGYIEATEQGSRHVSPVVEMERCRAAIVRFGLNEPVGLGVQDDVPCEITDDAVPGEPNETGFFYYLKKVSAMHLATGYAAVANGGVRVQPRLIKGLMLNDGERYLPTNPPPTRRIMSAETAQKAQEKAPLKDLPTGCSKGYVDVQYNDNMLVHAGFIVCNGTPLVIVTVADGGEKNPEETTPFRRVAERIIPLVTPNAE